MAYLFIMHHCTRVETVTPEQEELEPEIIANSTPVETQGRPLSISYTLFLDQRSICVLFALELLYICH